MLESPALATGVLCGQLVLGGFDGKTLPASYARALAAGERGGAVLFKRNIGEPLDVAKLNAELRDACAPALPPLLAVDQEGGRVARIGPPLLALPPMQTLAGFGDETWVAEVARAQAEELVALGFTMNFAPVLDVNTRASNPVIGDRAFGSDANVVARFAIAYARGLTEGGLLACGKHFPGHGDTTLDSHFDLPTVTRARADLEAIDLAPFRAAIAAGVPALMTAHVVVPALDPHSPATLSRAILTGLLRETLGYRGWLVSDDLEMKAVADRAPIEETAVRAIDAGCDAILVCHDESLQARAHAALTKRAEQDSAFYSRCVEAAARGLSMRRRVVPRPASSAEEIRAASARARRVNERLEHAKTRGT